MSANDWWSYDHEDGVEFHATEAEAISRAESCLEQDRDRAPEGWPDEVTDICYGRVYGRVEIAERRPATEDDNIPGCDEYVDYYLATVGTGD